MNQEQAWSIYEANVQSYRSIMLSSQSLLLAVGAILIEKPLWVLLLVSSIAMIQLWYIWFRVIYSRVKVVDYYKFGMYKTRKYTLNQYIEDKRIRTLLNKEYGVSKTFRPTRLKLDIILSITINFVWVVMLMYNVF